jgi:hypothetical protein
MIADCGLRIADCLVFALCLLGISGCGRPQANAGVAEPSVDQPAVQAVGSDAPKTVESLPAVPTGFGPARVCILPLTELPSSTGSGQAVTLNAYIGLLDAFGCQIKAPYVLRFELYQYVPRSAQPKGQRLAIWPDIDLTHPAANNKCWRDFLRAYEFKLDAPAGLNETYVLEATCMCPDGRRLTTRFPLRGGP